MIVGTGVDITTISRVAAALKRFPERFPQRILHPDEFTAFNRALQPDRFLAKRFATKEAAVKALGTGERNGVLLRDFYVDHDTLGKPCLHVSGVAEALCHDRNITRMHLSLSDELDQVIAFVVFEADGSATGADTDIIEH